MLASEADSAPLGLLHESSYKFYGYSISADASFLQEIQEAPKNQTLPPSERPAKRYSALSLGILRDLQVCTSSLSKTGATGRQSLDKGHRLTLAKLSGL